MLCYMPRKKNAPVKGDLTAVRLEPAIREAVMQHKQITGIPVQFQINMALREWLKARGYFK
jgi:hypothetical protein